MRQAFDNYSKSLTQRVSQAQSSQVLKAEESETDPPTAFSYSLYYMYYDQYTYINGVLFQNIVIATGAIIVVMQLFSGLRITLLVAFCALLSFIELMGAIWMFNVLMGGYAIEMNAVLVVNLVTSLGLAFEFCSHIAMNFAG